MNRGSNPNFELTRKEKQGNYYSLKNMHKGKLKERNYNYATAIKMSLNTNS